MENKYYIVLDGKECGPYTYDELKTLSIKRDTLVWEQGMENWDSAENIENLKSLFQNAPPSIPTPPSKKKKLSNIIASEIVLILKLVGIAVIITSLFLIGFYIKKNPPKNAATDIQYKWVIENCNKRYREEKREIERKYNAVHTEEELLNIGIEDVRLSISYEDSPRDISLPIEERLKKRGYNINDKKDRERLKDAGRSTMLSDKFYAENQIENTWNECIRMTYSQLYTNHSEYDKHCTSCEEYNGNGSAQDFNNKINKCRKSHFNDEMKENGILCFKISLIILIAGRYFMLFCKWVYKNSKKQIIK